MPATWIDASAARVRQIKVGGTVRLRLSSFSQFVKVCIAPGPNFDSTERCLKE